MTKTKMLCVGLLLVFGLGLATQGTFAQNYISANTEYAPRQLRPNSNAEALTPLVLTYLTAGPALPTATGAIVTGQSFSVVLNAGIVGYSGIATAIAGETDFCLDVTETGPAPALVCADWTVSATPSALIFTYTGATPVYWTSGSFYIFGLRVNTSTLAPGTAVTATMLTNTPPGALTGAYAGNLWTVETGVTNIVGIVSSVTATTSDLLTYYTNFSCLGITPAETVSLTVTENWAGAWASLTDEEALGAYAPSPTQTVTNGTDITVQFAGLPAGVTITPEAPVDLIVNGVLGSQTWAPVSPPFVSTAAGQTASFTFIITATNRVSTTQIEGANFSFLVSSVPLTTVNNPPTTTSVILSPAPSGTTYYPAFSYPTLGMVEEAPGTPADAITWLDCQTTLFFPYVTNFNAGPGAGPLGNWDTALEVANQSTVPTNSLLYIEGLSLPTNGACYFSFYNAGTSATIVPAIPATPVISPPYMTPVILSGGYWGKMLSTIAPGFTGQAVAVCDFLAGEGYAQIVDNANGLGNWQVMSSYIAPNYGLLAPDDVWGIDPPVTKLTGKLGKARGVVR